MRGPATFECNIYAVSKIRRTVSRKTPGIRPRVPGAVISFDLPYYQEPDYNGDRYYMIFTYMSTGTRFLFSLATKSEIRDTLRHLKSFLWTSFGIRITMLISNNDPAMYDSYINKESLEDGIRLIQSAPSTPTQNSHPKRSGGVVEEKFRVIKRQSNFPGDLKPGIIRAAVYLLNRTPIHRNDGDG